MENNEEENLNDEIKGNIKGLSLDQAKEPKRVELTEEQRHQRALEAGMLFEQKEGLIKTRAEREKKKKEELVELRGVLLTTDELQRLVTVDPLPYAPMFPYTNSYFKELYRIYYPDRDYKEYPKPQYVATLFKEIIYGRFDKTILPALDALNPLINGRYRKRKLFQYLSGDGQGELVIYRDETVIVMADSPSGQPYEFRKKLYEKHKVPYQMEVDFLKKNT